MFDIDGTLVDSTAAVERTWRTWAAEHDLDAAHILSICHGVRSEDVVARYLPASEIPAATIELEDMELQDLEGVTALPCAADVLGRLPEPRWAAVTSGSGRLMRKRLSAAGLPVPDILIAADDVVAGKPDPEGYRNAAEALGSPIDRCLVIEDAPAGIAAGRAAGATVLAVCTSHQRAEVADADVVVDSLTDVSVTVGPDGIQVEEAPADRAPADRATVEDG
ncbi:HAD-IA family hydrolase [Rothia sp. HC945]|uniref:HAD-IA family hydrolase n=1 Tax=Rothia sp. HC945 TaxID=3171170 RepID=UPI00265693B4|nr:HAD-IA family hydrolase [Kocuria sp.]